MIVLFFMYVQNNWKQLPTESFECLVQTLCSFFCLLHRERIAIN